MKILTLDPTNPSDDACLLHDWESMNSQGTFNPCTLMEGGEDAFEPDSTMPNDWEHEEALIAFLYNECADVPAELHLVAGNLLATVSEGPHGASWGLFRHHDENTRLAGGYASDRDSAMQSCLEYAYQTQH